QPVGCGLVKDAVLDELERVVTEPVADLGRRRDVENEDLIAPVEERVRQMRPEKPRASRDEDLHERGPRRSPLRIAAVLAQSRASRSAWPSTWTRSSRSAPRPVPKRTTVDDTPSCPGARSTGASSWLATTQ